VFKKHAISDEEEKRVFDSKPNVIDTQCKRCGMYLSACTNNDETGTYWLKEIP